MYPYLRMVKVIAAALGRSKLGPFEDSIVKFRVWPGDLDQNMHLNNGRYLTMMDLGRFDLVGRTGMAPVLLRERWYPVVTAATIRYRKPLDAFQDYDLRTRLLGWDDRDFYIEQRFEYNGNVHAAGAIRGTFLGPKGRVGPEEMVARIAPGTKAPELPEWITAWDRSQDALAGELRASSR